MNGLNPRQWEAVTAPAGPALVLAGAGSGKTRVLTSRIAHLLEGGVRPGEILAVTFTNKAAREMRERLGRMVSLDLRLLWMGTFHGVAHRLLRLHHGALGLPEGFQVLDAEDSLRLIRRVMRETQLDEKQWPPRAMAARISRWKDEGWGPEQVRSQEGYGAVIHAQVYGAYEGAKARSGLVDFGDLLLYALRLWQVPEILAQYQRRIQHVLVDEFQDTNAVQYAWLKALAQHQNLFVVGDDDQAIYAWRGARVENLLRFGEDFPATRVVRLEQNYRSTEAILQAANAVIAHNPDRLGKTLWTEQGAGEAVQVYTAYNEVDEARYVVGRVQQWSAAGGKRAECAILYRSNAQSRAFEEALVREGVPYRVYGGLRFFERAEVKDALAYLRLLANRHDDSAFERVVNVPARGIGAVTLDRLRAAARTQNLSLWQAAGVLGQGKVNEFLNLVDRLAGELADATLAGQMEGVIVGSDLRAWHAREGERAEGRLENL
ncbi:MAG: UvrD-helicase domain-containing protein, partial [Acidithiobacillus sp.]